MYFFIQYLLRTTIEWIQTLIQVLELLLQWKYSIENDRIRLEIRHFRAFPSVTGPFTDVNAPFTNVNAAYTSSVLSRIAPYTIRKNTTVLRSHVIRRHTIVNGAFFSCKRPYTKPYTLVYTRIRTEYSSTWVAFIQSNASKFVVRAQYVVIMFSLLFKMVFQSIRQLSLSYSIQDTIYCLQTDGVPSMIHSVSSDRCWNSLNYWSTFVECDLSRIDIKANHSQVFCNGNNCSANVVDWNEWLSSWWMGETSHGKRWTSNKSSRKFDRE